MSVVKTVIPFSLSEVERKLVVMDSFSEVVNLARMPAFLDDHGSKDSSKPSALTAPFVCRKTSPTIKVTSIGGFKADALCKLNEK